ncbi:solute carrier family 66 member 1 L homeolog isoform X1 [Xenopus laevis]|uniref:Solute carrier family 66 member 1 L homeolog isoform X1 n=1 Tax=Xenopus laevis TaxID=8355 RepID=A0A8J1L6L9_XENLA|nr:solute carrier family 66 member 1 L homeolog isoform X1 [Xenopus laevis]
MEEIPNNGSSFPPNGTNCPNGTRWIWIVLDECTADARDEASVYMGLFSILCFMGASIPQFYTACKTGKMDKAISIWFLLGWTIGDSLNLVGTYLADQLPLQRYTSAYYIFADLLMLCFYFYFKCRNQSPSLYAPINAVCGIAFLGSFATFSLLQEAGSSPLNSADPFHSRHLLSTDGEEEYSVKNKIGFACGLMSTLSYLISRLPQIYTNFKRKSTEGLAPTLFLLVIVGNVTYGASVLLKNPESDQSEGTYVVRHLPWLTGSLGAVFLDLIILGQFFKYRGRSNDSLEREPLLQPKGPTYA